MRTLILLLALVLPASAAVVQNKFCATTATSLACSFDTATTVGNHVIVGLYYFDQAGNEPFLTDNQSSTYNAFSGASATHAAYAYWYGQKWAKPTAAVTTVTLSSIGGSGLILMQLIEFNGLLDSPADVGAAVLSNGTATFTSAALPTAASTSEVAICMVFDRFEATNTIAATGVGTWNQIALNKTGGVSVLAAEQRPLNSATPTCSGTLEAQTVAVSVGTYKLAAAPLTVSCPSATSGTVGTPYSSAASVSGGTPAYSCSVGTGTAPAGLSFSGCTLQGTPTTGSPFTFTVHATDAGIATGDSGSCSITISAAPPASARRRRIM